MPVTAVDVQYIIDRKYDNGVFSYGAVWGTTSRVYCQHPPVRGCRGCVAVVIKARADWRALRDAGPHVRSASSAVWKENESALTVYYKRASSRRVLLFDCQYACSVHTRPVSNERHSRAHMDGYVENLTNSQSTALQQVGSCAANRLRVSPTQFDM